MNLHSLCGCLFVNYSQCKRATIKILYHCEARRMSETIKEKTLQFESVLGSYGACKVSNVFPVEKPFKVSSLKLLIKHM